MHDEVIDGSIDDYCEGNLSDLHIRLKPRRGICIPNLDRSREGVNLAAFSNTDRE
jgi:hypothetical protein